MTETMSDHVRLRVGRWSLVLGNYGECDCRDGEPYVTGATPEYTTMPAVALKKASDHIDGASLYWGVHLRGRHVLDVKDPSGRSLRLGRPTTSDTEESE